jgi:hypothetical protein
MKLTLRKWQQTTKDIETLIVQASSMDSDDGWRPWPIGMCWGYVKNYEKGSSIQIGNHENLVLYAINTHTDINRRRNMVVNRLKIDGNLHRNKIYNQQFNANVYFDILPSYKFVISPEGNGIDCHRHYEAFIAGCIPIMERNPLIEEKYKGCPVLWTTDYSEITPGYLEQKYAEMIDQEYDFSRLFMDYYDSNTQEFIKLSGNFWIQRLLNIIWYKK